jgi:ABC-type Zn uptake system ZnuABC Zn-binding protein ZnuA
MSRPKTGQHPPIYSLLQPYERFPKEVAGPSVWRADDLKNNSDSWTYEFSQGQIEELGQAADAILGNGIKLTDISQVSNCPPGLVLH